MAQMADWLEVLPHWLRFGSPNESNRKRGPGKRPAKSQSNTSTLYNDESRLMERFRQLTPHQQNLITELVIQLALEKEIWPEQTV